MGSLDPSPIPPHAITMWLTDHDIIAALPMKDGSTPYLMKLPLSEGGLRQALELLHKRKSEVLSELDAADLRRVLHSATPLAHPPQVKLTKAQEKLHAETTPEQRAKAMELIMRMGIKK